MNCQSAKRGQDSGDEILRDGESSLFEAHQLECESCESEASDLRAVRSALQRLPRAQSPVSLRTRLRITASQERRLLLESDGSRFLRLWRRWKFRLNEMMRPFTIPATGGLASSLVLFTALAFTILTSTTGVAYDVPVLGAGGINANLVPVELRSAVVLSLSLDWNGRITDYVVRDGSGSFVGNTNRLRSNNNISLPEIPSVLAMAQPVSSDIRISLTPITYRQ
jgi:hypothetical protein